MKTIIKILLSIFIPVLLYVQVYAQVKKVDPDCMRIGEVYRVTVINGWVTEGKLLRIDSASIEIRSEHKIFSIPKSQITEAEVIFKETGLLDNKLHDSFFIRDRAIEEKIYLSVGAGAGIPSLWTYNTFNTGINFQFNVMKIMSHTHAIRGDFQYTLNTANNDHSDRIAGGHLNSYGIRINFLLGNFKKRSIVKGYAILGGGVNILQRSDSKYSYPEYDPVTMSYTGRKYTYTQKYKSDSFMNLDCGGGLNYKISDRVKLYGEAQYTFPLVFLGRGGGGFSPYFFLFGAPSLRVGAQVEL